MACGCPERRPGAARVERRSQDWTRRRRAMRHPGSGYTTQEWGPGAARPEHVGPTRRGRRAAAWGGDRSAAARGGALSAVAPRGDLVLRPLPWLLASWPRGGTAPAALAPGYWRRPSLGWRRLGRKPGGREKQRETSGGDWGMNRFRVWGGLREHLTRSWAFGGPRKRGWR